jgi:CRP-like cAMP-binding protein
MKVERMTNPLVRKLANVATLSDQQQSLLERLCGTPRDIAADRDILSYGERPDHLHLILEGWAMRYNVVSKGVRQITAFLIPGDFCDIHTMVLQRMDHSIATLCPAKVAYIPIEDVDDLARQMPELIQALWWSTLVDEAVLRAWIANLGRRDAFKRTAHMMCEMHERMNNVGLVSGKEFNLPLTQKEIADSVGLTPIHTNRVMTRLRDEGLISFRKQQLTIPDIDRLKGIADFDAGYLHPEHVRVG